MVSQGGAWPKRYHKSDFQSTKGVHSPASMRRPS